MLKKSIIFTGFLACGREGKCIMLRRGPKYWNKSKVLPRKKLDLFVGKEVKLLLELI